MSYSNLSDDASKAQVRQSMESAGIDAGYIDSLFAAVDDYNALDSSVLHADGFAEVPLKDLDYPGAAWPEDRNYDDANCRITAFALMRGPSLPYQATLFKDRGELEAYLMSRFHDFYTKGVSAKPFILENVSLLIPREG